MPSEDQTHLDRPVANQPTRIHESGRKDGLSEIFSFHSQIRAALSRLSALAETRSFGDAERESAQSLLDFFRGPLIWHDIDEETTLMPRLRRAAQGGELEAVLGDISDAHENMEEMLDSLLPMLEAVVRPYQFPNPETLREFSTQLRAILEPHLAQEEKQLLPFARRLLDEKERELMAEELAARRESRKKKRVVELP